MIIGLAPMDWYTDCAFRLITQEIFEKYWNHLKKSSDILFLRTEFMSADGYIARPQWVIQHLLTSKGQHNVIAQIHGGNEKNLIATIKDIQKKYADSFVGIEINMGCPAGNIMKSGWWSELLKDKAKTLAMLQAIKKNCKLPLSIKTRTGLNDADKKNQTEFILEASKICDMITIHARTVKQIYSWDADWDFVYHIKWRAWKKCKIIGNGWIHSYTEIAQKIWNLDGVMIWQAAIGNPRIFTPYSPTVQEKKDTILRHLDLAVACDLYFQNQKKISMPTLKDLEKIIKELKSSPEINLNKTFQPAPPWQGRGLGRVCSPRPISLNHLLRSPVIEFRKHLFQYIKWIPCSREWKQEISQITEYEPLVEAIKKFF